MQLSPVCKSTIWGGNRMRDCFGFQTKLDNIAEAWMMSARDDNPGFIINGEYMAQRIDKLIEEYPELLAKGNTDPACPLLIKFIDARQDLSIQVHPNDKLAWERHQSKGKTEMWYVVDADPGSRLRSGFAKQVTPDEYEQSIADNTITDLLQEYDIHKGDVFFLPAGRIHSIGAGAFIAEIQQTSNITYRIYDFNRCDDSGKPRELHTEMSKGAIDYTVLPDYRTYYDAQPDKATQLVACRYFTTDIYRLTKEYEMPLAQLDSFVILICTAGKGTITDNSGETINIHQGESILVPATTTGLTICPEGEIELLGSWIEE